MAGPTIEAKSKPRRTGAFVRLFVIFIFLVLVGALAAAVVRGEWADAAEKNPVSPDEEAVTQLFRKSNGNVVVRCAILVDAPPKDVWAVVSGYAKHGEFLPDVSKVGATPQKDGRFLVAGTIHSRLWGAWDFKSMVQHSESPKNGEYSATWSERDVDEFKLNRGSWSVTPTDRTQRQTLLACTLQIELKECPNFVVRDILLYQLPAVVKAMRDETLRRKHGAGPPH